MAALYDHENQTLRARHPSTLLVFGCSWGAILGTNALIEHRRAKATERAAQEEQAQKEQERARKAEDDRAMLARGMPPGYYLERNDAGQYRPVREQYKLPLNWTVDNDGSKAGAIRRAWGQVEHETVKADPGTWRKVEEKK